MFNKQSTFVAFLDILGFSDLVTKNSHDELITIYKQLDFCVQSALSNFNYSVSLKGKRPMEYVHNLEATTVNSMTISDSIILWTNDDSIDSFRNLILTTNFLLYECFTVGLPLRGGIAIGPLSIMNAQYQTPHYNQRNTFFGKSIVDAYRLEQKQKWSGCIISRDCINHLFPQSQIPVNISNQITQYPVPFKTHKSTEYVIKWPRDSVEFRKRSVIESFSYHQKSITSFAVRRLILNTLNFIHYVNSPL